MQEEKIMVINVVPWNAPDKIIWVGKDISQWKSYFDFICGKEYTKYYQIRRI